MTTTKETTIKLQNVLEGWAKDVVIDKTMPQDAMVNVAKLHAKYLRILTEHKLESTKIQKEYEEMRKLRSLYYSGALEESELKKRGWEPFLRSAPKTQTQKQEMLDTDEFLTEILLRQKFEEEIVTVCESIIQHINYSLTTQLKEFMQWERTIRNG